MAYPVSLTVQYPDKLSRGLLLLKVFFGWLYVGIPHGIALGLYGIAVSVVMFIAFWAILFTGRFPRSMYDFVVGYWRWSHNVQAYMGLLIDEYPPFSGDDDSSYPANVTIEYPAKLSRGLLLLKVFFGWLYVGIPHGLALFFYGIAAEVVTL